MRFSRDQLERYLIDSISGENRGAADLYRSADLLALDERLAVARLQPYVREIKSIAEGYTNERKNTIAPLSAEGCRAYALYYLLINFEKIQRLLASHPAIFTSRELKVLDYGTGPGTAAFAVAGLRETPFSLTALDWNPSMCELARTLLRPLTATGMIAELSVDKPALLRERTGRYDLIIAAHVLNELPPEQQKTLVDELVEQLSEKGSILIIESALKEQTRELMGIRDYMLTRHRSLKVVFPCTHENQCPMLTTDKEDWCHGAMSWNPPHLIRQIDALTGFNKHRIKYSAFILSRNDSSIGERGSHYRIVAPPERSKKGDLLRLCGEDFYGDSNLRKSSRNEGNIEYRRADLYDRLEIEQGTRVTASLAPEFKVKRWRAP